MRIVYLFLVVLTLAYVLLKKRKLDFWTVAVGSTIVYYYPAFLGKLLDGNHYVEISSQVYICLSLHIILLFFSIFCYDHLRVRVVKQSNVVNKSTERANVKYSTSITNMAVLGVGVVGLILLLYTYLRYSGGPSGFNKMQLLQQSNRMTEYLKYVASFVFVYSFVSEGKYVRLSRIIGILLIAYTFFLGHRSFAVICLIAIFLHMLNKNKQSVRLISYIRKRWKLFVLLFVFLFFFMFVKNVFAAFMTGQYDLVRQRLTDPDYYLNMLLNGESNAILWNLNKVCVSEMQYSIVDYFLGMIGLIPVIGNYALSFFEVEFFETKLNRLFNSRLGEGIGLGSTYLGEAYATGWYVFLIIALIGTFVLISYLQRKKDKVRSKLTYTWLSLILVYFTFYIHRNSLIYLLITMRAYLYILILTCLFRWVLTPFFAKTKSF